MQPFEDVFIEDILQCGSNDFGSGLQARLYFAPASYFSAINLPTPTNFQESLLISVSDVFLNGGMLWNAIDILIDENEIKTSIQGGTKRKKSKTTIDLFILGFRAKVLGFVELLKNEDLIFCINTSDGHGILVGNLRNFANIDKADGNTGKKYEDNSGVSVSINCNSPVYIFKEKLIIDTSGSSGGGGGMFEHFSYIDITQDY